MTIKLLDYARKAVEVDVGDLDDIAVMKIKVLSGDEILTVIYKDYSVREFDSSCNRMIGYYDHEYEIYNVTDGTNLLNDPEFMNRVRSYWYEDAWFGE